MEKKMTIPMTSTTAYAILLFCSRLPNDPCEARPLTPTEWSRLETWVNAGLSFEHLIDSPSIKQLENRNDRSITVERLQALRSRKAHLESMLREWDSQGIWTLTRVEPEYPNKLLERLGSSSPPILYGTGPRELLVKPAVAIVGSRDASSANREFSANLGFNLALQGIAVVSGGAKGIDEESVQGALSAEGYASVVVADGLVRSMKKSTTKGLLASKRLVMVSAFGPESKFGIGAAMGRNKYIYCLSDGAVVITTKSGAGGTWAGATENMKRSWVKLWTRPSSDEPGNIALQALGAECLNGTPEESARYLYETIMRQSHSGPECKESPPAEASIKAGQDRLFDA